jgi:hypothetical protein
MLAELLSKEARETAASAHTKENDLAEKVLPAHHIYG